MYPVVVELDGGSFTEERVDSRDSADPLGLFFIKVNIVVGRTK